MKQDEFTKLFTYIEKMRSEMNHRFDTQDKKSDDIAGAVIELAGELKDYHQELLALSHKVDRLERWIHEIAEKTGVKLSYDNS